MPDILGRQFKPDPWDSSVDPVQEFHDTRWGHCEAGDCTLLAGLRELEGQIRAMERLDPSIMSDTPVRQTTFPVDEELWVVCGISGCTFTVERGEGRTMALHQSGDHGREW